MNLNERRPLFWPNFGLAESDTFEVARGGQVTVVAMGLQGDDKVTFEIAFVPAMTPDLCACPPGVVTPPTVAASAPLTCCGEPVTLTETQPFVIIDAPQNIQLRAVADVADISSLWTWALDTATPNVTDRLRGCPCASPAPEPGDEDEGEPQ